MLSYDPFTRLCLSLDEDGRLKALAIALIRSARTNDLHVIVLRHILRLVSRRLRLDGGCRRRWWHGRRCIASGGRTAGFGSGFWNLVCAHVRSSTMRRRATSQTLCVPLCAEHGRLSRSVEPCHTRSDSLRGSPGHIGSPATRMRAFAHTRVRTRVHLEPHGSVRCVDPVKTIEGFEVMEDRGEVDGHRISVPCHLERETVDVEHSLGGTRDLAANIEARHV